MIHCDEVFDILTRGPFPTGAPSDGIVESHLGHCDACRQLAEALQPALELLQEAIAPAESEGLPRYGGIALARAARSGGAPSPLTSRRHVARPAARFAATLRRSAAAWPWRSAAKFAAAACAGLALAGMLREVVVSRNPLGHADARPVATAATWQLNVDGPQWMAEQGLGDSCRQWIVGVRALAVPARDTKQAVVHIACCLNCHAGQRDHLLPADRIGAFTRACQACH